MTTIELAKYSDTVKSLIELHKAAFDSSLSEEYWKWKFVENPMSLPGQQVVVATESREIVGARPHMYGEMWLGEKKVRVAQHCDTMVHPKHQGKGIFTQMEKCALKQLLEENIAFSYGFPNKLSRNGFLKLGYRRVIDAMAAFHPIDSYTLISSKTKNRVIAKSASVLFNLTLKPKKHFSSSESNPFQFEVIKKFTPDLADIECVRGKAAIDLVRSKDFLKWRFDSHPIFDYKYILIKKNAELVGYAVLSVQKYKNGVILGRIVDHVVANSDVESYRHLINQSLIELEKQYCDCYVIFASGEPNLETMLFKNFGFKSSAKFPYNRFMDDGYLDAIQVSQHLCNCIDIFDSMNWRVTYAFYNQT
jgi:GNAT superfamily N-acetyltransferase